MTKVYPVVLFPAYIIPFFVNRDWKNAWRTVAFLAVIMTAMVALPYIAGSGLITEFIEYHSSRPLQIESVAASFISVAKMFGLTDAVILDSYGSTNLIGAWPDAIAPHMTVLMGILVMAMYAVYTYLLIRIRKIGDRAESQQIVFGCGALLSILLFIVAGLIFSAQYIIWAVPFILFLFLLPIGHPVKKNLLILSTIILALTQLNVDVNFYIFGSNIGTLGLLIILVRNIFLLVMAYYVFRIAWDAASMTRPASRPSRRSQV